MDHDDALETIAQDNRTRVSLAWNAANQDTRPGSINKIDDQSPFKSVGDHIADAHATRFSNGGESLRK